MNEEATKKIRKALNHTDDALMMAIDELSCHKFILSAIAEADPDGLTFTQAQDLLKPIVDSLIDIVTDLTARQEENLSACQEAFG